MSSIEHHKVHRASSRHRNADGRGRKRAFAGPAGSAIIIEVKVTNRIEDDLMIRGSGLSFSNLGGRNANRTDNTVAGNINGNKGTAGSNADSYSPSFVFGSMPISKGVDKMNRNFLGRNISPSRSRAAIAMLQPGSSNTIVSAAFSQGEQLDDNILADTKSTTHSRKFGQIIVKDSFPGPGSYAVNTRYTSASPPAYSFGIPLPRPVLGIISTPGPGSYNITSKPIGPCFSIAGREKSFSSKNTTAPGNCDPRKTTRLEGLSISLDATSSTNLGSPGPGLYDLTAKNSGPCCTITGRMISASPTEEAPGPRIYSEPSPGTYTLPSPESNKPSLSLLRRISPMPECSSGKPSPGNYTSQLSECEARAFDFRNRLVESSNQDQSPAYEKCPAPISPATPSFTFDIKPSKGKNELFSRPSSDEAHLEQYEAQANLLPSASCTERFRGRGNRPHHKQPCRIKGKIEVPLRAETSGPGAVSSPPNFSVGNRLDFHDNLQLHSNEKPGHGVYKIEEPLPERPDFRSLKRTEPPNPDSSRPETYKPPYSRSDSPLRFGNHIDQCNKKEEYDLSYKASGGAFQARRGKVDLGGTPGPGSYNDRLYAVGTNGPFFSLLGRIVTKQCHRSPGPAAYRPKLRRDGPSFSIYGRINPIMVVPV